MILNASFYAHVSSHACACAHEFSYDVSLSLLMQSVSLVHWSLEWTLVV